MTKTELIDMVVSKSEGLTKKAGAEIVDAIFDSLANTIRKEKKFTYPGFGTFVVRQRKARTGRDPRTGQEIKIAASKTVGFKPAKSLKESL